MKTLLHVLIAGLFANGLCAQTGSVGIGTTAPTVGLQLAGFSTTQLLRIGSNNGIYGDDAIISVAGDGRNKCSNRRAR